MSTLNCPRCPDMVITWEYRSSCSWAARTMLVIETWVWFWLSWIGERLVVLRPIQQPIVWECWNGRSYFYLISLNLIYIEFLYTFELNLTELNLDWIWTSFVPVISGNCKSVFSWIIWTVTSMILHYLSCLIVEQTILFWHLLCSVY